MHKKYLLLPAQRAAPSSSIYSSNFALTFLKYFALVQEIVNEYSFQTV